MKENGRRQVVFEISLLMIPKSSIFNSRTSNSLSYYNLEFVFTKLMSVKLIHLVMNVFNQLIHIVGGVRQKENAPAVKNAKPQSHGSAENETKSVRQCIRKSSLFQVAIRLSNLISILKVILRLERIQSVNFNLNRYFRRIHQRIHSIQQRILTVSLTATP